MFTKYGYSTLAVISVIILVIIILSLFITNDYLRLAVIIIALLFFILTLNFFRDPERITPSIDNIIVSPADGKVLFVKDVIENKFIKGNGKQISVFMSPLNVHVNRIPVSGRIDYLEYFKGKYLAAFEDKASELNERVEFGITSKLGKIFFAQVAGFVARRIVYEISTGDA
ncbi:MAG TPA: phosphatidylserine decarboxylase, partial [Ignavibacteriaceae bacterium]|nr:phosphatidylserine decarboxylase [Ignavibacteriaceae bacterium]